MDESDHSRRIHATQQITEEFGVKESWRIAYRYIRAKRGRDVADLFLSEHTNKKITCRKCGVIETPKLIIKKNSRVARTSELPARCVANGRNG